MNNLRVIYSYIDETQGGSIRSDDISDLIAEISLKTTLEAQPGTLNMSAIGDGFEFILGSSIKLLDGETSVFDGFIFSVTSTRAKSVQITAYDVLRYLKNKDTFIWRGNETASDIVKAICSRFDLETGTIDAAEWPQPARVDDNAGGFDIIREAIENALAHEKRFFVLLPEGKKIAFRNVENLRTDIIIDEENGEIDFSHNANIDRSTFNSFKIVCPSADKWQVLNDEDHKKQWGLLQYSQSFGESVKPEQLPDLAQKLETIYNRPQESLSLTCFGNWQVRAGMGVHIRFKTFKSFDEGQGYYVKECTHRLSNALHQMHLVLCVQNVV